MKNCPCGAEMPKGSVVCGDCWKASPGDVQRSFYRERSRGKKSGEHPTQPYRDVVAKLLRLARERGGGDQPITIPPADCRIPPTMYGNLASGGVDPCATCEVDRAVCGGRER